MLRLTGGEFRGRFIETPANLKTRPTQSRLRQALFNSLQTVIAEANVLDLFAGSGALGFEALSRGARRVTFVEENRNAVRLIERNAETLGVRDRVRIIGEPLPGGLRRAQGDGPFDIVLADPPYAEGWEAKLLATVPWPELLAPAGHFCLEWGKVKSRDYRNEDLPEQAGPLTKVREKPYGDSILTTYELGTGEAPPATPDENDEGAEPGAHGEPGEEAGP